ncbi:MAG: S-layer homology domain-containing protein, partial [Oscillospiraceae bacterium]|nr:S-layer homology domain-containing protein [Oscillospiraceae bacterium]
MRLHKIAAAILALAILFALIPSGITAAEETSPHEYSDVKPKDWYYGAVSTLSDTGILDGFPDGTFGPEKNLTVAQFIKMVCISVLPAWIDVYSVNAAKWSDAYYYAALDSGLLRESEFSANALDTPISRYDAGLILSRALENVLAEKVDIPAGVSAIISDIDKIPAKYVHAVQLGFTTGLLTGYSNGEFRGDMKLTRAQGSVLIVRLIDPQTRVKPSPPPSPDPSAAPADAPADPNAVLTHTEILTTGGKAAFIGDSLTHGLYLYGKMRDPDYFFSTGMSVFKATAGKFSAPDGTELTLSDMLSAKSYSEIYLMFGINELGANVGDFTEAYGTIIDKVAELNPDAEIFIQSVLPISEAKHKSADIFTIDKITTFN